MTKDATLLPCPFCGCTDLLTEPAGDPDDRWYRVTCVFDGCAADGPLMRNQKDAARAWNARRAVEPPAEPGTWIDNLGRTHTCDQFDCQTSCLTCESEPTREHPTTDPATAYGCNHPAFARGLTGCLICGASF